MLQLDKYMFEENADESNCLHICFYAGNQGSDWNIDCFFKQGIFKKEEVIPEIFINDVSTDKNSVEEYKGYKFSIRKLSDCDEMKGVYYFMPVPPKDRKYIKLCDTFTEFLEMVVCE